MKPPQRKIEEKTKRLIKILETSKVTFGSEMILDHKVQRHIREQIMGRYIPERKLSLILENKTIKFVSQEEDVYIKKM